MAKPIVTLEFALERLRQRYEFAIALGYDIDISEADAKVILDHFGVKTHTEEQLREARNNENREVMCLERTIARPPGKDSLQADLDDLHRRQEETLVACQIVRRALKRHGVPSDRIYTNKYNGSRSVKTYPGCIKDISLQDLEDEIIVDLGENGFSDFDIRIKQPEGRWNAGHYIVRIPY